MAPKPRFRILALPQEQQEQLRIFQQQFIPGNLIQEFLDSIEEKGKISEEIFDKGNFNERDRQTVQNQLAPIIQGLPSKQAAQEAFVQRSDPAEEAQLSETELGQRLEAFQEIGGTQRAIDRAQLERFLKPQVQRFLAQQGTAVQDKATDVLADIVSSRLSLPSTGELVEIFDRELRDDNGARLVGRIAEPFENFFNDQNFRNDIAGFIQQNVDPRQVTPDVERIQNLLQAREFERQQRGEVEQLIGELPGELARGREEFIAPLRQAGQELFQQELTPQVLNLLNVRGLLDSAPGILQEELGRAAVGVQQPIESAEALLQEEDDLFFQDAGFQFAFEQEIQAGRDVSGQLGFERQQSRTGQEQRFLRTQADLQRQFAEDLTRRRGEAALAAQEAQLRRQQQVLQRQRKSALTSGLARSGGALVGAGAGFAIGGPVGASLGASLGQSLGAGLTT